MPERAGIQQTARRSFRAQAAVTARFIRQVLKKRGQYVDAPATGREIRLIEKVPAQQVGAAFIASQDAAPMRKDLAEQRLAGASQVDQINRRPACSARSAINAILASALNGLSSATARSRSRSLSGRAAPAASEPNSSASLT